jgi:hypothetical protein
MCRWGFSNVVKSLKSVTDDRVRAYIVWTPIFGGNFMRASRQLSKSFPDKRVSYFADSEALAGHLWERVLKTGREEAWDVYFLYGAEARWNEEEPPMPDFWMHQLWGVNKAPQFKEPEFTAKLKEMLAQMKQQNKNQTTGKTKMKIEFLYFEQCPSYKQALANLKAALAETKAQADLKIINVRSEAQAERVAFQGSPSIRINGKDLDGRDEGSSYGCRIYQVGDKVTAVPSKEYIKARLDQLR